jgi:hypothetical protein
MFPERALRCVIWACAVAGGLVAFAWPFVVSLDPDSAMLRWLSRTLTAVFLLALAVVEIQRARRRRSGG